MYKLGRKVSETTQITNQNQQKKIDFRKIIHMHFTYSHETFRPTYIFYLIDDVHRLFIARSRRGKTIAIHVGWVNYAFMRTNNNLVIDVIDHYYAPGNNMPGGEIINMVRINKININEKDDIVIITYNRNGEDREITASSQVIKFLRSLMYNHEIIAVLDAIVNYTI